MDLEIKKEGEFTYFESDGPGVPIVLLHGLMGALSNFEELIKYFEGKKMCIRDRLCANDISPGLGLDPPPTKATSLMVW